MGHFPFYLIVFLKVMTLSLGSTILLPPFLRIFTYQTARKSCIFRLLSEGRKGFWSEWLIASNWAFIMSRSFEKSFLWISTLPSHENGWDKCPFFTRNDLTVVISFSPQKAVENCNSVFFSIVLKVVDLCALWNLGRNWHYEFRPWMITARNLRWRRHLRILATYVPILAHYLGLDGNYCK